MLPVHVQLTDALDVKFQRRKSWVGCRSVHGDKRKTIEKWGRASSPPHSICIDFGEVGRLELEAYLQADDARTYRYLRLDELAEDVNTLA
jgi:hypothetical protein